MKTDAMKLDGNAIGGLLLELFGRDLTTASSTCRSCGSVELLACVDVYVHAPGTVVRCRHCQSVLMRIVRAPDRWWVDVSGLSSIEVREP